MTLLMLFVLIRLNAPWYIWALWVVVAVWRIATIEDRLEGD